MTTRQIAASVLRVGLGVSVVLSVPGVAMRFSDQVAWTWSDFVAAGLLLATIGAVLELAVHRAGTLVLAAGSVALGGAAAALGQADDAPGLVLLGLVLMVSGGTMGLRSVRRTGVR